MHNPTNPHHPYPHCPPTLPPAPPSGIKKSFKKSLFTKKTQTTTKRGLLLSMAKDVTWILPRQGEVGGWSHVPLSRSGAHFPVPPGGSTSRDTVSKDTKTRTPAWPPTDLQIWDAGRSFLTEPHNGNSSQKKTFAKAGGTCRGGGWQEEEEEVSVKYSLTCRVSSIKAL